MSLAFRGPADYIFPLSALLAAIYLPVSRYTLGLAIVFTTNYIAALICTASCIQSHGMSVHNRDNCLIIVGSFTISFRYKIDGIIFDDKWKIRQIG